jgi:hypothetical protein
MARHSRGSWDRGRVGGQPAPLRRGVPGAVPIPRRAGARRTRCPGGRARLRDAERAPRRAQARSCTGSTSPLDPWRWCVTGSASWAGRPTSGSSRAPRCRSVRRRELRPRVLDRLPAPRGRPAAGGGRGVPGPASGRPRRGHALQPPFVPLRCAPPAAPREQRGAARRLRRQRRRGGCPVHRRRDGQAGTSDRVPSAPRAQDVRRGASTCTPRPGSSSPSTSAKGPSTYRAVVNDGF